MTSEEEMILLARIEGLNKQVAEIPKLDAKISELNGRIINLTDRCQRLAKETQAATHQVQLLERFLYLDQGSLEKVYRRWKEVENKLQDDPENQSTKT